MLSSTAHVDYCRCFSATPKPMVAPSPLLFDLECLESEASDNNSPADFGEATVRSPTLQHTLYKHNNIIAS